MSWATAAETASVRINGWLVPTLAANISTIVWGAPQLSDTKQESGIREVRPIAATWLTAVQRRIQKSAAPPGQKIARDQRWLSQDIADAAIAFFRATSDVLPSEPHIYSSLKGSLVAEFSGRHGTMTNLITQTSVIVFAVVDGVPVEMQLQLVRSETDKLRQGLHRLTKMLRAGRHGTQLEPQD